MTAVDLMFMLSMVEDIEELLDFLDYHDRGQAQVISWGGISDTFSLWKQEQGYISKGAQDHDIIYTDFEASCAYVSSLYMQWQDCFPFNLSNQQMVIPEQWKIVLDENDVHQFAKKIWIHKGAQASYFKMMVFFFVLMIS